MPPVKHDDLLPLEAFEVEELRAEYQELPARDARRRLIATHDSLQMQLDVLRRLLADARRETK